MDTTIWSTPTPDLRIYAPEVGAWALSPDDAWLATADAFADDMGLMQMRVVEVATGRAVIDLRGGPVKALAWASPEALLVVRGQGRDHARAILHAVPDGGVLGSIPLEWLPGAQCRLSFGGGASPTALVAPWRWDAALRSESRRRVAYVLRTEPLEVIAAYDPDATDALPRIPEVRAAAASLAPDGHQLLVWQGGAPEGAPGTLLVRDLARGRDARVCAVGNLVREILWVDADTVALRSAYGTETEHAGDVDVVSLSRGEVLSSSVGEDPPNGWVGANATVDVHPDRTRVLVAGRDFEAGPRNTTVWKCVLRVVTPERMSASPVRTLVTQAPVALGAAWLPPSAGEGFVALRARTKTAVEFHRFASITSDVVVRSEVTLALEGKSPSSARIARSPGQRFMVVHWRVAPTGLKRTAVGAIKAARIALIEASALAR